MGLLTGFEERTLGSLAAHFRVAEISAAPYAEMAWPRWLPLMRFRVRRYVIGGFGHLLVMHTGAMGLMKLATASFMPNSGVNVPYLLVDMMSMGKKRTVFVEYYDTRALTGPVPALDAVHERYAALPDYAEKPRWYVSERMPCSLIKGGTAEDEAELTRMVTESVAAYVRAAAEAGGDSGNLAGLAAFAERMVREGNPSTGPLERVLGREGAERFFREAIMPLKYEEPPAAPGGEE